MGKVKNEEKQKSKQVVKLQSWALKSNSSQVLPKGEASAVTAAVKEQQQRQPAPERAAVKGQTTTTTWEKRARN